MEKITIKQRSIDTSKLTNIPIIDGSMNDNIKKELTFRVNESPNKKCWRLVHVNGKVKDFFEAVGITSTINNLVCGTKSELEVFISKNSLKENKENE